MPGPLPPHVGGISFCPSWPENHSLRILEGVDTVLGTTPPGRSERRFQDDATLNHKRQILLRTRCTVSYFLLLFRPQLALYAALSNRVFLRPVLLAVFAYQEPWRHVHMYGVVRAVNLAPFGWGLGHHASC